VSDCGCSFEPSKPEERRVLWILLAINGGMFVVELVLGLMAESTALVGDSFDMFADASVYGVGLWAVSRAASAKVTAAKLTGYLQLILGVVALAEVSRRLIFGSAPDPNFMIGVAVLALIANVYCLRLISAHREGGVHMRASFICSQTDVIVNVAVVIGGILVAVTHLPAWDLIVGAGIAAVILWGSVRIFREARVAKALPNHL